MAVCQQRPVSDYLGSARAASTSRRIARPARFRFGAVDLIALYPAKVFMPRSIERSPDNSRSSCSPLALKESARAVKGDAIGCDVGEDPITATQTVVDLVLAVLEHSGVVAGPPRHRG